MLPLLVIAALVGSPTFGSWRRYLETAVNDRTDQPPAHGLAYFRVYPCLRGDPADHILQCSSSPRYPEPVRKVRTKLRFVGSIRRFAIYDLEYYFDEEYQSEDTVGLKSILVKTGPDEFHEIYVRDQADVFARIHPSEIVNAGRQRLLVSGYSDGGNSGGYTEVYFAFDRDAAIRVDFDPIFQAATAAVPKDKEVSLPAKIDFPSLKWQAWTTDRDLGRMGCCEGQVTITFHIDSAGRITITGSKYDPTADFFRR